MEESIFKFNWGTLDWRKESFKTFKDWFGFNFWFYEFSLIVNSKFLINSIYLVAQKKKIEKRFEHFNNRWCES